MIGASLAPVTLILIALTAYASIQGFRQSEIVEKFLFSTDRVFLHREYSRVFTSAFVHADWAHLIFNMISFYSFGSFLENRLNWGSVTLISIYGGSLVGGNLVSLLLHRRHADYRALGASGGVCGVIFASIVLLPPGAQIIFFVIPMPPGLYAIIFLAVSIWGIRASRDRIGHDAHLGGAMIGLLITLLLYPAIITQKAMALLIVFGASLLLLIYLYAFPPSAVRPQPFSGKKPKPPARKNAPAEEEEAGSRHQRQKERDKHDKATMNRLLDKISKSGIESLSEFERKQLEHISRRMRGPKH